MFLGKGGANQHTLHALACILFYIHPHVRGVGRVCGSTGVWVDAERRHGGVFVHEAVCDSSIGALVSVDGVDLQNKRSRRLVLQD